MAYLPLSTANLPDPAIDPAQGKSPEDYFVAVTYAGNGGSQTVPTGLAPDLLWIKQRNGTDWHHLFDELRGHDVALYSNETAIEGAKGFNMSLNADSFSMNTSNTAVNGSSGTYVAWNWKANGSGSTIAAGSIDGTNPTIASQVSANTESGFSICTFTSTGSDATVGHGLNSAPDWAVFMRRNTSGSDHLVYHSALGATKNMRLNNTDSVRTQDHFLNTEPTSSVFSLKGTTFADTRTYVAYFFHSVEGFSKFGSFSGNNSTDGPFIYLGFRPALFMVKCTNTTGSWYCYDTTRLNYNVMGSQGQPIAWDTAAGEDSGADASWYVDALSNGIKIRNNSGFDNGTNSFIYMAFAENPFKFSLAR